MKQNPNSFQFTVDTAGNRLDKFVSENCPGLSRSQAQKLIDDGYVIVNGLMEKASHKTEAGEKIEVTIPPPAPTGLLPEAIPVKIIYEDDDLLVIDKPAGLTVHPAPGHPSHTLVNAVLAHLNEIADEGDVTRPGIVHRLDKDTSGVMLVAKNNIALANLADQFKARTVKKTYIYAGPKGFCGRKKAVIDVPIGRDSGDRKKDGRDRGKPWHSWPGRTTVSSDMSVKTACWKSALKPAARTRFAFTWRQSAIRFLAILPTVRSQPF